MAVIKCSNCENEILDTEIVCPYCDYPVSTTKEKLAKQQESSALAGETVKIKTPPQKSPSKKADEDVRPAPKESEPVRAEQAPVEEDATRKISADDIQSETLRRSLEERRAQRAAERKESKARKEHKLIILSLTLIGILVIIFLVVNVIGRIRDGGVLDPEKENKKSKVEATSAAEEIESGFEFHSHTLTITEEAILRDGYKANDKKPWDKYSADTTILTVADGIEIIGDYSFDDLTKLNHVTIASSVSSIGESAFYGCTKLEVVALDAEKTKLASIGDYAFTDCRSLETFNPGTKIKRIGEGAFKSCASLEKIYIPDSTKEIGDDAFLGCLNLVIVCSQDSYAHKYAIENGIDVELTDGDNTEADEEEDTPIKEPEATTGETKPADKKPSETKPSETKPAETKPAETKPSEQKPAEAAPSNQEQINSLWDQLGKAQTQEEKDEILKKIGELTQ